MKYQIKDGTVTLGGETILSHIDFEIQGNQKIAVVGRNGAGKTTLLRLIAGELSLDRDDRRQGPGILVSRQLTVEMLGQQALAEEERTVEELMMLHCPATVSYTHLFMYTLPYIEAFGTEIEVIPGIPSFCAAAAISRTPLTAWDEDLLVAPVRKNSPEDLTKLLKEHDNVVFMKPSSDKEALLTAIKESGRENSFVLVEKVGTKAVSYTHLGGSVAVALLWRLMFLDNGVINAILTALHLPVIQWLGDTQMCIRDSPWCDHCIHIW